MAVTIHSLPYENGPAQNISDILPPEAFDADIAILGKKGKGKTYTAKVIVEHLLRMKRRVLILDPMSVWWGLRSSSDGTKSGFPIAVFGGQHGDIPLKQTMGRPLAQVIARENFPAVIDMGDMRKAEWQRFTADFFDELYTKNRDPLTIVLEEADVFAPQQPMKDYSMRVLGEVDRIARRGRAFGFRLISITQRPAKLNKDILTQLSVLVAMGLTSPQDRDAVKAWVDGNADREKAKEVYSTIAQLPLGEGWVWAPDFDILKRVKFPKISTLDTSSTPKAGTRRIEPKTLADVDLGKVRKALDDKVEDLKAEHKTKPQYVAEIKRLNQTIERLKEKLKEIPKNDTAPKGSYDEGWRDGQSYLFSLFKPLLKPTKPTQAVGGRAPKFFGADPSSPKPTKTFETAFNGEINLGAEKKPLAALAGVFPGGLSESQWATIAGYKRTGGTWSTYKSRLRTNGLIVQKGELWHATEHGVEMVAGEAIEIPETLEARIEFWSGKIPGIKKMLWAVYNEHPEPVSKHELAEIIEMTASGGSFSTYLSRLRTNGIIEIDQNIIQLSSGMVA